MTTIKIKTSNLNALAAALRKEEEAMLRYANFYYRQSVMTLFEKIVNQTPQFGGDLARNWYLGIGGTSNEFDAQDDGQLWANFNPEEDTPRKMGDQEAVSAAVRRAGYMAYSLRYIGQPAYIYNTTPYAEDVDMGKGPMDAHGTSYPIRAVNLIDGVVQMLAHNVAWAASGGSWKQ